MSSRRIKLAKRVLFLVVLAISLFTTTSVLANYIEYRMSDAYGNTYWLSCGSSYGDYFYKCPAQGGPCEVTGTEGAHQACIDIGYYPLAN